MAASPFGFGQDKACRISISRIIGRFALETVRVANKTKIRFVVIGKIFDGDAEHGKSLSYMGKLHERETATAIVNEDAGLQCVRFKAARFFQSRLRVNSFG